MTNFSTTPNPAVSKSIYFLEILMVKEFRKLASIKLCTEYCWLFFSGHGVAELYTVFQKNQVPKLLAVTLSNLNRFVKFFH